MNRLPLPAIRDAAAIETKVRDEMKEHGVSLDNHASKAHAAEIQKYIELAEALLTNIAVLEQEDEGAIIRIEQLVQRRDRALHSRNVAHQCYSLECQDRVRRCDYDDI